MGKQESVMKRFVLMSGNNDADFAASKRGLAAKEGWNRPGYEDGHRLFERPTDPSETSPAGKPSEHHILELDASRFTPCHILTPVFGRADLPTCA